MRFTKDIAIFYIDEEWANKVFNKVIKNVPSSLILSDTIEDDVRVCRFTDGGWIRVMKVSKDSLQYMSDHRICSDMTIVQYGQDIGLEATILNRTVCPIYDKVVLKYDDIDKLEEM